MRIVSDYVASTSNKFFPRKQGTLTERFWSKVVPEPNTGCWIWCGDHNGHYGNIGILENGRQRRLLVHRLSYEMHIGPIPAHLQIDHWCNVKLCVNPDHLHLCTGKENVRKIPPGLRGNNQIKTHCKYGHALSGSNLAFNYTGHAVCRECQNMAYRKYHRKRVPNRIKIIVALRQLKQLGATDLEKCERARDYLRRLEAMLCATIGGGSQKVVLDHDPPIRVRPLNKRGTDTVPPMNDPNYLAYITSTDHHEKTFLRGRHGQYSDIVLIKRERRRNRPAKPKRKIASRAFPKRNRTIDH
jgi:hypothetical protein